MKAKTWRMNDLLFQASCAWRRGVSVTGVSLLRLAILMAGVASLASMACVVYAEVGVARLGVANDGSLVAMTYEEDYSRRGRPATGYYGSLDGGLTWKSLGDLATSSVPDVRLADWRDRRGVGVVTPRGRYALDGPDVILVDLDGQRQVVYSTAYLLEDGNTWIQQGTTQTRSPHLLAEEPLDIVFDDKSGNLALALWIQGVVVGTPDGEWVEVGVGPFRPTDFRFLTKTVILLTNLGFWITALTLAFSMTTAGLFASQSRLLRLLWLVPTSLGLCLAIAATLLVVGAVSVAVLFWAVLLAPVAAIVALLVTGRVDGRGWLGDLLTLTSLVFSMLFSVALLWNFGQTNDDTHVIILIWFVIMAWALGLPCLTRLMDELTDLRPVASSIAVMTGLVALAFMPWLHLGISHGLVVLSSLALCGAAAIGLAAYIRRDQRLRKARWEARPLRRPE